MSDSEETNIKFLAKHLVDLSKIKQPSPHKRWIIGIIGIPCSGKSFIAHKLTKYVNKIANSEISCYIGMDGFHFTRKYLDNMKNPKLAHQKRGAHWTFDAIKFGKLLKNISININNTIIAPTFDHSIKDPVFNGQKIFKYHKIVIVEGLYLFLNKPPWNKNVLPYFDERWLIECDWNLAEKRIIKRHVKSGIVNNEKDALFRWIDNDKPNGQYLLKNLDKSKLNVIMKSREEDEIKVVYTNWKYIISKL